MFAKYIHLDDGSDGSRLGKNWPQHRLIHGIDDVWKALARMDGDRVSILIVAEAPPTPDSDFPFSGKAMAIAGGNDDQYLCEAYVDDTADPVRARNPAISDADDELVPLTRGQLEHFWRRVIVNRATVRKALEAFVRRGELSDQVDWQGPKRP